MITLLAPFPAILQHACGLAARQRRLPPPSQLDSHFELQPGRLNPEDSVSAFRSHALQNHAHVESLCAAEAFRLMVSFYRKVRARNCAPHEGGDALHCEWGLYHCGRTELFHFEITRQFTQTWEQDEETRSRLTLALHYRPTPALREIHAGELWCPSRLELAEFECHIVCNDAYAAVTAQPPVEVAIEWNPV